MHVILLKYGSTSFLKLFQRQMFAPSDSKLRFFKISIYNGHKISALRRMPSMTHMLHTTLFPKFLRGHPCGRKSVFCLHLDHHSTCMNRLYTSRIFPILRKIKNKKLSERTSQTTSFHKNNRSIQPFMADTCFHHTPKLRASSCFQPTVHFLNSAYCISSNTLV